MGGGLGRHSNHRAMLGASHMFVPSREKSFCGKNKQHLCANASITDASSSPEQQCARRLSVRGVQAFDARVRHACSTRVYLN